MSLLAVLFSFGAPAQVPTQQQLDIYRNLPPDQQRAILESLGRGGGGLGSGNVPDRTLQFPETVRPRDPDRDPNEDEQYADREPRFKGGDTFILYLDIRKYQGRDRKPMLQATPTVIGTGPGAAQPQQQQPTNQPDLEKREEIVYTPERADALNLIRERIERRNPLTLDENGALHLPETGPVPLAGLTVAEAEERLAVHEQLKDFSVAITRLPLRPQGTAALKPFGYDLFAGSPTTFAPATDVPVPADYVVGPGDVLHVQLIGNTKGTYTLTVDREGKVNFPDLGPINVGGMRFEAMRAAIERRVREEIIGTQASVSMGELRSIRIFVLGDAERPGSYTVSGLSTMTNALFVSGGVKPIGSLRNIELKRSGETVTTLDLYDLLLKGDTRSDARLLPGDVIFINPIGSVVGVAGSVRRPAIYEIRGATTVKEVVALSGGLSPEADARLATIERIDDNLRRIVQDLDLTRPEGLTAPLRSGDTVRVPTIRPVFDDSVSLTGYVYRPRDIQYRPGMRLSDLLPSLDELKPNADQNYILIRRESSRTRRLSVFSADLAGALVARGSSADIELAPRDRVHVFDLESGRDNIIEPLLRELQLQSNIDAPAQQVRVGGRVKAPGQYPWEAGMRVSDLIRAGGNLDQAAFDGIAELTRYEVVNGESRVAQLIEVDLKKIRSGDASADVELRPFDHLVIKETPLWAQQEVVELRGEVRFPGRYPIHRGETLKSVLERAGGWTEQAFVEGAVFTRSELRERERKQIDTLATRMQSDLTQLSLQAAQETGRDVGQALSAGQALLTSLRETKPVGRLVIDLPRAARARSGSDDDVVLKDGDLLVVPRAMQEVTVLGEVQSSTSHLYRRGLSRDDYVELSGGLTQRADRKRTYVVKADGSVVASGRNTWFGGSTKGMAPGDTVVVPLDAERMRPLPMWQAITTIIYNLAIAAAAINSF